MNDLRKDQEKRLKQELKQNITIHWWNMGTKTLDCDCTVKEYLNKHGMKFRKIINEDGLIVGYNFKYSYGSSTINYKYMGEFNYVMKILIVLNLTYLGDRAKIKYDRWDLNVNKR